MHRVHKAGGEGGELEHFLALFPDLSMQLYLLFVFTIIQKSGKKKIREGLIRSGHDVDVGGRG